MLQGKWTPLLSAINGGHVGVVKLLLEEWANPNVCNKVRVLGMKRGACDASGGMVGWCVWGACGGKVW